MTEVRNSLTQGWLQDHLQRIKEKYGPVLKTRHYVVEHYPAIEADFDSYPRPARNYQRTEPTDERESHEAWVAEHVPSRGASFVIRTEYLREKKTREWVNW